MKQITLQEALDQVAKNHRFKNWDGMMKALRSTEKTIYNGDQTKIRNKTIYEAAELYASTLKADNEKLRGENKELKNEIIRLGGFFEDQDKWRISFWFMRDNHTFKRLEGNSLEEIKNHAILVAKENHYGLVCNPIILQMLDNGTEKEVKRVGETAHVDGEGKFDVDKWFNSFCEEPFIKNYDFFKTKTTDI